MNQSIHGQENTKILQSHNIHIERINRSKKEEEEYYYIEIKQIST